MSTLARDFGAEHPQGREAWIQASYEFWLKNYVKPGEREAAQLEVQAALDDLSPDVFERGASWAMIRFWGRAALQVRAESERAGRSARSLTVGTSRGEIPTRPRLIPVVALVVGMLLAVASGARADAKSELRSEIHHNTMRAKYQASWLYLNPEAQARTYHAATIWNRYLGHELARVEKRRGGK